MKWKYKFALGKSGAPTGTLSLLFVVALSGFSALVFEGLWFRQASLGLGSSLWASSLVLAGFMAGIGLGNLLASRLGDRSSRPIRIVVGLETCIAVSGIALVYGLPGTGGAVSRALGLETVPWIIHLVRFTISFMLLLVPTTAMGLTLPLLTRALSARDHAFGRILGTLYGLNTLGGVLGALCSEMVLVEHLGIRSSAWVAGGIDLIAATGAYALASRFEPIAPTERLPQRALSPKWVATVAVSGFAVLALEVVWFRFLLLYVLGTPVAFTLMLSTVLAGIGIGSALTARVGEHLVTPSLAGVISIFGGVFAWLGYAASPWVLGHVLNNAHVSAPSEIILLAVSLVFPVCLASGAFFTLVGILIRREVGRDAESVGVLTLANTAGAVFGSLAGGFVLLPKVGIEVGIFTIGLLLVANGLILVATGAGGRRRLTVVALSGLTAAVAATTFPFGLMRDFHVQGRVALAGGETIAVREGLTETIIYLRQVFHGQTTSLSMVTNSHPMAGNSWGARRYMKLFTYLPAAVHPNLEHALLISFGCGQTARSLVDTASLKHIDVVDISRDIIEMNSVIFPDPHDRPANDPRVKVHIEDGRYFLASTAERYDLITAEPPPPSLAGVVNLYTREFFELVYDRLAEGGITTYWLPIHDLTDSSSKSILRAFCDVFEDCTLWQGSASNLMMVGTRGNHPTVSLDHFESQWRDPRVGPELRSLGFERPEQLGALFIGDTDWLRAITADTPPLVDDQPNLLYASFAKTDASLLSRYPNWSKDQPDAYFLNKRHPIKYPNPTFESWINVGPEAQVRFQRSGLVRRLFPPNMIVRSLPYFPVQHALADIIDLGWIYTPILTDLLKQGITLPALLSLGSDPDIQAVLSRIPGVDPEILLHRAIGELVHGQPNTALATLADLNTPEALRVKAVASAVRNPEPKGQ
jgi:spermidine synthase